MERQFSVLKSELDRGGGDDGPPCVFCGHDGMSHVTAREHLASGEIGEPSRVCLASGGVCECVHYVPSQIAD